MSTEYGDVLLKTARASIASQFGLQFPEPDCPPPLLELGATFVTLTLNGALRGCIGTLDAHRTIVMDTRQNAKAAAFHDPRFLPLAEAEHDLIRIEVSLLSNAEPLAFAGEEEALLQLRPGIDGIIFECGSRRSTFLPQVWESLTEPEAFLAHLKQKAGFPSRFWTEEIRLSRYTVSKWKETHG